MEEPAEEKKNSEAKKNFFEGNVPFKLVAVLVVACVVITAVAAVAYYSAFPVQPSDGDGGSCDSGITPLDMQVLNAKVGAYINENILAPQGFEGVVTGIEEYNEFLDVVSFDVSQDGEVVDSSEVYVSKDGKIMFSAYIFDLDTPVEQPPEDPPEDPPETLGTFTVSDNEICKTDGKPVVYLFSTTWCGHCNWVKDTFDSVMKEYVDANKIVAYHWEIDIDDDTLTEEVETEVPADMLAVYNEFNPGGSIPTFVFGCKYSRIGNGYEQGYDNGLELEENEFRQLIDTMLEE